MINAMSKREGLLMRMMWMQIEGGVCSSIVRREYSTCSDEEERMYELMFMCSAVE